MPPHHHEPPSHDPALDADDSATSTATYRACIAGVDPEAVLRSIRRCNGFRSWALAPCETYQLANCSLRVYEHHERPPKLVLDGPTAEEIHSILARLGFERDVVINELQPAEES